METFLPWAIFSVFVIGALIADLTLFGPDETGRVPMKTAARMSGLWIGLAALFAAGLGFVRGAEDGLTFLTGYLIELSLSVDNLFVFLLIFGYFGVSPAAQRKALAFGIIGAVVFRLIFIVAGVALIERFHGVIYLFGAFLVYTGVKMIFHHEGESDPEKNVVMRLARRFLPVADADPARADDRLFVRAGERWFVTPLFVAVLMIETSDIIFAVDSIPAILAITLDPFIVYTSNIFAILGLRSLFFALAGVMDRFHLLHYALAFILSFLGAKMLLSAWVHPPMWVTFAVIGVSLGVGVTASLTTSPRPKT
jgi:tellurite resistance protein TerC